MKTNPVLGNCVAVMGGGGGVRGNPGRVHSNPSDTRCRVLGRLGDVNPIEYGGGFVLSCTGGGRSGRSYEIEIAPFGEEDEGDQISVYRTDVPDNVWEDVNWANVRDVASGIGADPDELLRAGSSSSPMERASVVQEIANYYGWENFDSYPERYSAKELRSRWRGLLRSKR